jgi:hypothetical protein
LNAGRLKEYDRLSRSQVDLTNEKTILFFAGSGRICSGQPYLFGSRVNFEMVIRTGIVIEIWKTLGPSMVHLSCKRNSPLKCPPDISMQTSLTSLRPTLFTGVNDHPTYGESTDRNFEDFAS